MRFLLGSAALVLVSVVVACSAAPEEGTAEEEAIATPGPARSDESPTEPAAEPVDAPPAAPVADGGMGDGASEGGGGGGGSDGGTQCVAGSVAETEGNDTAGTANGLPSASSTFCGSLTTASDVDFVSFVLPKNAKGLGFGVSYTHQGLVVTGRAGGESFNVGGKPAFRPGETYVLEVRTTGKAPVSYRLSLDIQQ